jgi:hypothetical protein
VASYDKAAKVADKLLGVQVRYKRRETDHVVQNEHNDDFVQEFHLSF